MNKLQSPINNQRLSTDNQFWIEKIKNKISRLENKCVLGLDINYTQKENRIFIYLTLNIYWMQLNNFVLNHAQKNKSFSKINKTSITRTYEFRRLNKKNYYTILTDLKNDVKQYLYIRSLIEK